MSIYTKSLEHLFVSKVRVKAITFFMLNPKFPIHLRGAVRELKEEINAVRRELMRLVEMKLLTSEKKGNRKYFQTNMEHPFIDELLKMVHKSYGLGAEVISNQSKLGQVDFAILTGSFTKGVYHGDQVVDLFLVGNIDLSTVEGLINKYESDSGREVRYSILRPSEFEIRRRRNDKFIMDLMVQETVMLIGNHDDFVRGRG